MREVVLSNSVERTSSISTTTDCANPVSVFNRSWRMCDTPESPRQVIR